MIEREEVEKSKLFVNNNSDASGDSDGDTISAYHRLDNANQKREICFITERLIEKCDNGEKMIDEIGCNSSNSSSCSDIDSCTSSKIDSDVEESSTDDYYYSFDSDDGLISPRKNQSNVIYSSESENEYKKSVRYNKDNTNSSVNDMDSLQQHKKISHSDQPVFECASSSLPCYDLHDDNTEAYDEVLDVGECSMRSVYDDGQGDDDHDDGNDGNDDDDDDDDSGNNFIDSEFECEVNIGKDKKLSCESVDQEEEESLDSLTERVFSQKTVFTTSIDRNEDHTNNRVPYDDDNLCLFTALSRFKLPKLTRFIKISKHLCLSWMARKSQNQTVFDWSSLDGIESITNQTKFHEKVKTEGYSKFCRNFKGVSESQLLEFERFFKVRIHFYTKRILADSPKDKNKRMYTVLTRASDLDTKFPIMNIHMDEDSSHCDLILNINVYGACFACSKCMQPFKNNSNYLRHEKSCKGATSKKYVGGPYTPPSTIFDQLKKYGVEVPEKLTFNTYFTCYDFETYTIRVKTPGIYNVHYIPYAYGICSNVNQEFRKPRVMISRNPKKIVADFMHHLCRISDTVYELRVGKFSKVFVQLDRKIKETEKRGRFHITKKLLRLSNALDRYIHQIIVVGYNSSRFDIACIRSYLLSLLKDMGNYGCEPNEFYKANPHLAVKRPYFIEKGTQTLSFQSDRFKCLDICLFAAPGCSYDQYLKMWAPSGVKLSKLQFPHGMMKENIECLKNTLFPRYQDFHSDLKQRNMFSSEEEYQKVRDQWVNPGDDCFKNGMTLKNLLIEYQIGDVSPMLRALEEQAALYRDEFGLDFLSHNITLASLSWRWGFIDNPAEFFTFPEDMADIHDEILEGRVGGCTIALKRQSVRGELIPKRDPSAPQEKVDIQRSLDMTNMYPAQFLKEQFTGLPICRRAPNFKAQKMDKCIAGASNPSYSWLQYVRKKYDLKKFHTKFNSCEVLCTPRCFPTDGYAEPTADHPTPRVFEFLGCYTHSCDREDCRESYYNKRMSNLPQHGYEIEKSKIESQSHKKYVGTMERLRYIEEQGFELEAIWECEWNEQKKNLDLGDDQEVHPTQLSSSCSGRVTEKKLIEQMRNGTFFGIAEVRISTPKDKRSYFSIFPPIFKRSKIGRKRVGNFTAKICAEQDELKSKREQLITCFSAKKTVLTSGLILWYLNHGLEIEKIFWTLEYKRGFSFKEKVETAAELRRMADDDPKLSNLGQTCKLLLNCLYGKSAERVDKRTKTHIVTSKTASRYIKSPRFKHLTPILPPEFAVETRPRCNNAECLEIVDPSEIDDYTPQMFETDLYKVDMAPAKIVHRLPIVISLFTLCSAKEALLHFIYDVLDKYLRPNSWEMLYSDTDSVIISLSSKDMGSLIRPQLREEFFTVRHKYFPTESCEFHRKAYIECKKKGEEWKMCDRCEYEFKRAKRTPSLWKVEAEATKSIFLCAKTYTMFNEEADTDKASTKGLNKELNNETPEKRYKRFENVLYGSGAPDGGYNRGMKRSKSGSVLGYHQYRAALPAIYCKRKVLDDRVTTEPLDTSESESDSEV